MSRYTKIITLDDHFPTGEPTIQIVSTWGRDGRLLREKTSCHKTAAHSPALDYIKTVEPEPGKTIVLIVGLGDHETYGPNRNGDGFPSEAHPGKISADEVLPKHYKSYENAHVYEHHVNSDPAKAIGRVKKAFWNPDMRRVEVLQDFEHSKAPHLLEKIAAGQYLAASMGARIKHDVCTNCGNRARTRGEYCDHLKYAMSQIDPHTGKQNAALNPSPVFFDSSFVVRPADRTGYMLKKVAKDSAYDLSHSSFDLGELRDELSQKAAALAKAADIEKILSGEPVASVSSLNPADARLVERYSKECPHNSDPADSRAVQIMISYKPSEALGTADDMGLPLGIKDLIEYFLGRMTGKQDAMLTDDLAKSASAHLKLAYTLFSRYPRFYSDLIKNAGLEGRNTNVTLAEKLAGLGTDYIGRHLIPPAYKGNEERPLTDMISWTDPQTGRQYNTNYGTVRNTHDALTEQAFKSRAMTTAPLLGGSALLGAGALAMGLHPKLKGIPRLATGLGAVGLGALGVHNALRPLQAAGPKVLTDQGETISGWSEMVPKRASLQDLSDTAPEIEYITKRANDDTSSPLPDAYVERFLNSIKTAEIYDELSAYVGPSLDLDRVAQALGNSILNRVG